MFRFRGIRRRAEAGDNEAIAKFPIMYRKMYHAMDALRETRKNRPDLTTAKERRDMISDSVKKTVALMFGSSNMQHVYHERPDWKHIEKKDTGAEEYADKQGSVRYQLRAMRERQIKLEKELKETTRIYKKLARTV